MTPNEIEKFEEVNYVAIEQPLTWYQWLFGVADDEIEADPQAKKAKFRVTQQIKNSAGSHIIMKKHQADTSFDHTQSVVKTDQKMEDRTSELPSPYKLPLLPPTFPVDQKTPHVPPKKLHPSIAQLRNKRFRTTQDDIDL